MRWCCLSKACHWVNKAISLVGAACAVDSQGNFWLFGGLGFTTTATAGKLNDVWKFDGTNWTVATADSINSTLPTVAAPNPNFGVLGGGNASAKFLGATLAFSINYDGGSGALVFKITTPSPVSVFGAQLSLDRKSTRLNSSHTDISRMPSSA